MAFKQNRIFKNSKEQLPNTENTAVEGFADSDLTSGQKPEFDTIGTALNEL